MTMREIAAKLTQMGFKVDYRVRKDGGIIITSINNQKFDAAKGNLKARELVAETLSTARQSQLGRITRERTTRQANQRAKGTYIKLEPIDKEVKAKLHYVQSVWKKHPPKDQSNARVLLHNIRQMAKAGLDKQDILDALDRAKRYARHWAYVERIDAFIQAIKSYENDSDYSYMVETIIARMKEKRERFNADNLELIFIEFYDFQKYAKLGLVAEAETKLVNILSLIHQD